MPLHGTHQLPINNGKTLFFSQSDQMLNFTFYGWTSTFFADWLTKSDTCKSDEFYCEEHSDGIKIELNVWMTFTVNKQ